MSFWSSLFKPSTPKAVEALADFTVRFTTETGFKNWFEGYASKVSNAPSPDEWRVVVGSIKDLDATSELRGWLAGILDALGSKPPSATDWARIMERVAKVKATDEDLAKDTKAIRAAVEKRSIDFSITVPRINDIFNSPQNTAGLIRDLGMFQHKGL